MFIVMKKLYEDYFCFIKRLFMVCVLGVLGVWFFVGCWFKDGVRFILLFMLEI